MQTTGSSLTALNFADIDDIVVHRDIFSYLMQPPYSATGQPQSPAGKIYVPGRNMVNIQLSITTNTFLNGTPYLLVASDDIGPTPNGGHFQFYSRLQFQDNI
jgi:hypothetical protein